MPVAERWLGLAGSSLIVAVGLIWVLLFMRVYLANKADDSACNYIVIFVGSSYVIWGALAFGSIMLALWSLLLGGLVQLVISILGLGWAAVDPGNLSNKILLVAH